MGMKVSLRAVSSDDLAHGEISVETKRFVIGRHRTCDLSLPINAISRRHCELIVSESSVRVRDLDSRNGVYVNDKRVDQEHEIQNGDRISIGKFPLQVVISKATPAADTTEAPSTVSQTSKMGGSVGDTKTPGNPASGIKKSLSMMVRTGASKNRSIAVTEDEFTIGRDAACDYQLKCESVSRRHCVIRRVGSEFEICDFKSRNGTSVGGKQIHHPEKLRDGDELKIGDIRLLVSIEEHEEEDALVTDMLETVSDVEATIDASWQEEFNSALRELGADVPNKAKSFVKPKTKVWK